MIRLYQLTIDTGSKDAADTAAQLTERMRHVAAKHPAMRGCTINTAADSHIDATLRVHGRHQWAAQGNARAIATAILLRIGIPAKQAQIVPLETPRDGRSLTVAQGRADITGASHKPSTLA